MSTPLIVGFVGTGIMGAHMARRLAGAGHCVRAWNRTTEKAQQLSRFGVTVATVGAGHDQGSIDAPAHQDSFTRFRDQVIGLMPMLDDTSKMDPRSAALHATSSYWHSVSSMVRSNLHPSAQAQVLRYSSPIGSIESGSNVARRNRYSAKVMA